jgi:hypothetical protein
VHHRGTRQKRGEQLSRQIERVDRHVVRPLVAQIVSLIHRSNQVGERSSTCDQDRLL